jgi:hypothetical protein
MPQLQAATVVGVMGVLLRFLAMVACAFWLRAWLGWRGAWVAGALYVLMPYVAFYNPQYRMAFAETAAAVVLPLVFWAVDATRENAARRVVLLAAAIALLAQVHLPSMVIMGGLVVVYGALQRENMRAWVREALVIGAAVVLGLALSAFAIVPALTLLPEISTSALQRFAWQDHFLFKPRGWLNPYFLTLNLCLLVPLLWVAWAVYPRWRTREIRALLGTFILAGLLLSPLAKPVWFVLQPLQQVQFPWRFLLPISLLAAALAAWHWSHKQHWAMLAVLCVLATVLCLVSLSQSHVHVTAQERQIAALNTGYVNAPEYMPADAAQKGWWYFEQEGNKPSARALQFVSPCLHWSLDATLKPTAEGVVFDVSACVGEAVLPQFYFPGWVAKASENLAVDADPASGLVRVQLPSTPTTLTLQRVLLPQEQWGRMLSLLALLVWGGMCAYSSQRRGIV